MTKRLLEPRLAMIIFWPETVIYLGDEPAEG